MYPTRLNLMSERKQQHIKRMLFMSFIKNVIAVVFIVLTIFSIFTIFAKVFLQSYFADVALQSIRAQNPVREVNERVLAINSTLIQTKHIQEQYIGWSSRIEELAQSIPDNVTITNVQFLSSKQTLELTGSAPTREDLLSLKNAIEFIEETGTVTIPLSDLTKQRDISFSLSIPYTF